MSKSTPNIVPERLHIVIGVVLDTDGKVLISKRRDDAHQGSLWEFPGGKLESGEGAEQALARELSEEIGIQVKACLPCHQLTHDYPDRQILLDAWWVRGFDGIASGREGQPVSWVAIDELADYEFPVANQALLAHLKAIEASGQVPGRLKGLPT
jgi:8-oxo-dGTP diphosphatase